MQTQNPAESFSFEEDSRKRHHTIRNSADLRKLQDQFILHDTLVLEDLDSEVDLNEILVETNTDEYDLNEQLTCRYPSAVRTSRTLYEILIFCLIQHLYNDPKRSKLAELKSLIYSQSELEDLTTQMTEIPEKYRSVFTAPLLKTIIARCFRLLERELEDRPIDSDFVIRVLSKHPVMIFAMGIVFRKLVKKLSLLFEMQIEDESVYRTQTQPELDVLWLICEFFQVNIIVYQLDGKLIKQQKFKVNEGPNICIVRNSELQVGWSYLCLRQQKLREVSEIHADAKLVNQHFWKTNSSASELKLITYFDKEHVDNSPEIKTKRKGRSTRRRNHEQKHEFEKEFGLIKAETEDILGKGQSVLEKFQKILSSQNDRKVFGITRTVSINLAKS